jgi:hypothetical protein
MRGVDDVMASRSDPLSLAEMRIRRMTQAEAHAVAKWRYEGPYSFYDRSRDPDDLEELLDPGAPPTGGILLLRSMEMGTSSASSSSGLTEALSRSAWD